jgi:hypothetical protein
VHQALGNAEWCGCRLKDVLQLAGVKVRSHHTTKQKRTEYDIEMYKSNIYSLSSFSPLQNTLHLLALINV